MHRISCKHKRQCASKPQVIVSTADTQHHVGYDVGSDEGYLHVNHNGTEAINVVGGSVEPGSASQDTHGSVMGGSVEGATADLAPTAKGVL